MARSAAARKVGDIPKWTKVREGLFAVPSEAATAKPVSRKRPPCRSKPTHPLTVKPARKAAPRRSTTASASSPKPRSSAATCARTFRTYCFFGFLIAVTASVTVWIRTDCAVRAYSIWRVQSQIVSERQAQEVLHVRDLALGTPARIEKMAQGRLAMIQPGSITFLQRRMPLRRTAPRREAPRRRPALLASVGAWLAGTVQDFTILSMGELGLPTVGR
jgi:hypothetical protein